MWLLETKENFHNDFFHDFYISEFIVVTRNDNLCDSYMLIEGAGIWQHSLLDVGRAK